MGGVIETTEDEWEEYQEVGWAGRRRGVRAVIKGRDGPERRQQETPNEHHLYPVPGTDSLAAFDTPYINDPIVRWFANPAMDETITTLGSSLLRSSGTKPAVRK